MPIKFKQPEPPPEPTWWDRIGGLPGAIASTVRAGSGLLSGEGGPIGALTSGAGEAAAQLVGGETFKPPPTDPNSTLGKIQSAITEPVAGESPTWAQLKGFLAGALTPAGRIGTAAVMGSVPLHNLINAGDIAKSAIRGAAYSGIGEAGREVTSGQQLDPTAIASHGAFGALLNAGLSKYAGRARTLSGASPTPPIEVQSTAQTGPGTRVIGQKGIDENLRGIRPISSTGDVGIPFGPSPEPKGPVPYGLGEGPASTEPSADDVAAVAKAAKARTAEIMRDQKNLAAVQKWRAAQDANKAAAAQIAAAREGMVPSSSVSESVSAPITGGSERMSTKWQTPDEAAKARTAEKLMEQRMEAQALKYKAGRMTARDKEFQEAMNARDVAETKATLQPQEPTVRETQRSAEGTKTIQWKAPSEETDSQGYKVIQRKSDYDALRQSQAEQIPPSKAAIETQVPPEARTTLSDWKDELLGPEGPVPAFKWPEAGEGTFTANAEGSHVQTPIVESTAAYAGAPAAEPQSPLAQFFKSPTDAVGSAYRAAKAEQGVNPLATRQLGISLQTEAQKAGLPIKGKVPNLAKFLQNKISPEIGGNEPHVGPVESSVETSTHPVTSTEPTTQSPDWMKENLSEAQSRPLPTEPASYEEQFPGATQEESQFIDSLPKDPMERITLLDRLKRFATEESGGAKPIGEINPELANFLGRMAIGGAGGGIVGGMAGHPFAGAAIGALGGGLVGGKSGEFLPLSSEALTEAKPGFDKGINVINKIHNASMLSPLSVAKKLAGDIGGLSSAAIENPERAGNLWDTVTGGGLKEAYQTGVDAFHAPPPNVEEMSGLENIASKGPLSWSGRAMAGLTAGTKNLMEQSGFTPEEQAYYTFTGTPETVPGQAMLRAQRSSQVIQHLAPFARLAINRLERGFERSPVGPLMQYASKEGTNPDAMLTSLKRAGIGTGVGLAAAGLTPEDFAKEHPTETALISALAGPYSLPVAVGMATQTSGKSPSAAAARTVSREIPGLRLIEDMTTSPPAALRNYLSGYTNMLRPIAEGIAPGSHDPDVSGGIFDKAISNIPIVNQILPEKPLPRRTGRIKFIK